EHTPPMPSEEIMQVAENAWNYTEQGRNYFGQHGIWFSTLEYSQMVLDDGDAFRLLTYLKMQNGVYARFMIANGMAAAFKWSRKRLAVARQRLLDLQIIEQTRAASSQGPALYKWIR